MLKNKKKVQNFFKSIAYKLFKIIYGEISNKIFPKANTDITTENIELEKQKYQIFFCVKSRLYTDRIHDTAIIKGNQIIDGPSFQYRNNKNDKCENNTVFIKGTPRFKKRLKGTVLSLLTGGGGNSNYWHWLFDVLPRLYIIQNSKISNLKIDYYLFPSLSKKFQRETLDMLEISNQQRLSSKNIRHFFSDKIIATSHPYTLLNDPNLDSLNIPMWIFNFLKKKFLNNAINNKNLSKNYPKKIYINRKDATIKSLRYIINEKEVEKILIKKGFSSLTLSDHSFSEQINLFNNAENVVGLHGAGFANIIFCKPKTKIIELRPEAAGDAIKSLAVKNDLFYQDLNSKTKTLNYDNNYGDIEVNIDLLKKKLI